MGEDDCRGVGLYGSRGGQGAEDHLRGPSGDGTVWEGSRGSTVRDFEGSQERTQTPKKVLRHGVVGYRVGKEVLPDEEEFYPLTPRRRRGPLRDPSRRGPQVTGTPELGGRAVPGPDLSSGHTHSPAEVGWAGLSLSTKPGPVRRGGSGPTPQFTGVSFRSRRFGTSEGPRPGVESVSPTLCPVQTPTELCRPPVPSVLRRGSSLPYEGDGVPPHDRTPVLTGTTGTWTLSVPGPSQVLRPRGSRPRVGSASLPSGPSLKARPVTSPGRRVHSGPSRGQRLLFEVPTRMSVPVPRPNRGGPPSESCVLASSVGVFLPTRRAALVSCLSEGL